MPWAGGGPVGGREGGGGIEPPATSRNATPTMAPPFSSRAHTTRTGRRAPFWPSDSPYPPPAATVSSRMARIPPRPRFRAPPSTPTATPTAVPTPAGPADANCDGSIDESGLTELSGLTRAVFDSRWFDEQLCLTPDANGDGRVNAADYPELLGLLRP